MKVYKIETFSDKNNVGIWHRKNNTINKVAAIGVRVKKWIAYHGFAININNNLEQYKKIIPCGVTDKGVTNLINIKYKLSNSSRGLNKNLMLHSYQIKFIIDDVKHTYTALLPDYFRKLLKTKRLRFSGLK